VVPVRLQHPPTLDRTYQFVLLPATPLQTAMFAGSTTDALDRYGTVAMSGNRLAVGAPDHGGAGAVQVLRRVGAAWGEQGFLQPTADPAARAGASVAMDGDVLVVGAPLDAADDSGRAYVYRFDAVAAMWALDGGGTLAATTPAANQHCGTSVAVSGTRIVIGCPGEKGSGNKTDAGAVYMFRYDATSASWLPDGTFKGANAGDVLGSAVALSGTTAVIATPAEDDGTAVDAGAVRVLVRGAASWAQQGAKLRGDAVSNSHFGSAVAIDGDYAIVGAPGVGLGSAYVFHRVSTTWNLDGPKLVPMMFLPDLAGFGDSVAIDGTHLVVGAPREDLGIQDGGAVHVYRRELLGWTTSDVVTATNPSASKFGQSVALDGEWFAVGAPEESSIAAQAGAVYVFR
jgi:hypothetical protein